MIHPNQVPRFDGQGFNASDQITNQVPGTQTPRPQNDLQNVVEDVIINTIRNIFGGN